MKKIDNPKTNEKVIIHIQTQESMENVINQYEDKIESFEKTQDWYLIILKETPEDKFLIISDQVRTNLILNLLQSWKIDNIQILWNIWIEDKILMINDFKPDITKLIRICANVDENQWIDKFQRQNQSLKPERKSRNFSQKMKKHSHIIKKR